MRIAFPAENDGIRKLIPEGQFAWTGLFRSPWMWLDGRKGWLSYWSSNEPNSAKETWAVANFDPGYQRRWEDWDCTRKTAFVCFSDSKHVVKLKLVRNSYLDLNDSTLQEEQLQQKLIDQEGKENLKLSWKKRPDGNVFYPERKEDGF